MATGWPAEQRAAQRHANHDYAVSEMPVPCPSHTTLNVSGHIIITSHSAWDKIEASLRDKYTDEWGYLKVNRDYRYFRHVIDCLQALPGAIPPLPDTEDELRGIAAEFEFFNLPVPWQVGERLNRLTWRNKQAEYGPWHTYRSGSDPYPPTASNLQVRNVSRTADRTPELHDFAYDSGIASRSNTPGEPMQQRKSNGGLDPAHAHFLTRAMHSNQGSLRPSPAVSPRPHPDQSPRVPLDSPHSAPHLWQQEQPPHADSRAAAHGKSVLKYPIPRASTGTSPYSRPGSREGPSTVRTSATSSSPADGDVASKRTASASKAADEKLEDPDSRNFFGHPHSVHNLVSNEAAPPAPALAPLKLHEGEKICSNCKTTETCLWRDVECGNHFVRLCNACGLYFRANNRHRDPSLGRGRPRGSKKARQQPQQQK